MGDNPDRTFRATKENTLAKPRNPETAETIVAAAKSLFRAKGYNATSYSDLAKESGINRATVQDYFPKKRLLAVGQMQELRSVSTQLASKEFPQHSSSFAQHYLLGQIYLSALLCCEESRRFLCDILQDRTLMEDEIESDLFWSADFVSTGQLDHAPEREENFQDMVMAMGGLYELMYYSVQTGQSIDIPKRLSQVMGRLAAVAQIDSAEAHKVFDACAIEGDALRELGIAAFSAAF